MDGAAPFETGEALVEPGMLAVLSADQPGSVPLGELLHFHGPPDTFFKRRCDKDADVGNARVSQDHVRAAAQDHEILLLCRLDNVLTLVEEEGILRRETVETVEVHQPAPEPLQIPVFVQLVAEGFPSRRAFPLRQLPVHYVPEDGGVIVVDVEHVGQLEADVVPAAAVAAADADDQPVLIRELSPRLMSEILPDDEGIQPHARRIADIGIRDGALQRKNLLPDRIVLRHHRPPDLFILQRAGHVADQGHIAHDRFALGAEDKLSRQEIDAFRLFRDQRAAQGGAGLLIDPGVQIIDPHRDGAAAALGVPPELQGSCIPGIFAGRGARILRRD